MPTLAFMSTNSSTSSRTGSSPRRTISEQLSALGARLARVPSEPSIDETTSLDTASTKTGSSRPPSEHEESRRSVSRGRDFTSSGRGGIGNIRRQSASRDPERNPDLPEVPVTRGREREPPSSTTGRTSVSVGRGGAGNIRSPSRDADPTIVDAHEQEIIRRRMEERQAAVVSSGRGGAGNITPKKSRSRSRGPGQSPGRHLSNTISPFHSTGRGGAGNIRPGDGIEAEVIDEEERKEHFHEDGVHSTGRGGLANLTSAHSPAPEHHGHHPQAEFESTGRGGAGNTRSRSASRTRNQSQSRSPVRSPSKEKHAGGFQELWNRVAHPQEGEREREGRK